MVKWKIHRHWEVTGGYPGGVGRVVQWGGEGG